MTTKTLINPFELFGIDVSSKTLSLKDIKKAYYELSLECHPDKGGNKEDMMVIHKAYEYLKEQLANTKTLNDKDMEKYKQEFSKFKETQLTVLPTFSDIEADINAVLNTAFNKHMLNLTQDIEKDFVPRDTLDNNYKTWQAYGEGISEKETDYYEKTFGLASQPIDYVYESRTDNQIVIDYQQLRQDFIHNSDPESHKNLLKTPKELQVFFSRGNTQLKERHKTSEETSSDLMSLNDNNGVTQYKSNISGRNALSMSDYKTVYEDKDMIDFTSYKEKNIPLDVLLARREEEREQMDLNIKKEMTSGMKISIVDKPKEVRALAYIIENVPKDIEVSIHDKNETTSMTTNTDEEFVIITDEDVIKGCKKQ